MVKIIAFIGKSGSGKTYNAQKLSDEFDGGYRFEKLIQYTTRSIREGEEDGKDYFFLTEKGYDKLNEFGSISCRTVINGNKYGTNIKDIVSNYNNRIKIVIVNAQGCLDLKDLKEKHHPELDLRFVNIISEKEVRRHDRDDDHLANEIAEIDSLRDKLQLHDINNYNTEEDRYLTTEEFYEELRNKLGDFVESPFTKE